MADSSGEPTDGGQSSSTSLPLADLELDEAGVVAEDLEYLMDEWVPKLVPREVRRVSPVIRRLLVDGLYGRAWRKLGLPGEPWVTATSLDAMLGAVDRSLIVVACAPPGSTVSRVMRGGTMHIRANREIPEGSTIVVVPGGEAGLGPIVAAITAENLNLTLAKPGEAAKDEIAAGIGHRLERGMSLTHYLNSSAALVDGVRLSRRQVIEYVANKLGGVHYDSTRNRKRDEKLAILDSQLAVYAPANGPSATFAHGELISIAETLAESSDAARFRAGYAKTMRTAAAD